MTTPKVRVSLEEILRALSIVPIDGSCVVWLGRSSSSNAQKILHNVLYAITLLAILRLRIESLPSEHYAIVRDDRQLVPGGMLAVPAFFLGLVNERPAGYWSFSPRRFATPTREPPMPGLSATSPNGASGTASRWGGRADPGRRVHRAVGSDAQPSDGQTKSGCRSHAVRLAGAWPDRAEHPASSVRGPKHVVRKGLTPVLTAEEARQLLDAIDTTKLVGLRDRALIGVMAYSFARVGCGR